MFIMNGKLLEIAKWKGCQQNVGCWCVIFRSSLESALFCQYKSIQLTTAPEALVAAYAYSPPSLSLN